MKAFCGCNSITISLMIPNSVKTLGDAAFQSCNHIIISKTLLKCSKKSDHMYFIDAYTSKKHQNFLIQLLQSESQHLMIAHKWEESLKIPEIKTLGQKAFHYCKKL